VKPNNPIFYYTIILFFRSQHVERQTKFDWPKFDSKKKRRRPTHDNLKVINLVVVLLRFTLHITYIWLMHYYSACRLAKYVPVRGACLVLSDSHESKWETNQIKFFDYISYSFTHSFYLPLPPSNCNLSIPLVFSATKWFPPFSVAIPNTRMST
jgi:hypothetical protein